VSRENVEIVVGLLPGSDVDFAQLVRDDNMWAAWTEANVPFFHPDLETVRPGLPDGKTYPAWRARGRSGWSGWLPG
jgi:hypothetical protein